MQNDMNALSERTEALIAALTDATMNTANKVIESAERTVAIATDAAMARIEAGVELAQMKATLGLQLAQLDAIGKQKEALLAAREGASHIKIRLLDYQIEGLTAQESAILQAAGVPPERALKAVAETDRKLYQRNGSKFEAIGEKS